MSSVTRFGMVAHVTAPLDVNYDDADAQLH